MRRHGIKRCKAACAAVEHLSLKEILARLAKLEEEIQAVMKALEGMLK